MTGTNNRRSFKQFIDTNNKHKIIVGVYSFVYPSINEAYTKYFKSLKHLSHINKCDYKIFVENHDIVKWIRKLYPKYARNILFIENMNNIQIYLHEKGYKDLISTSNEILESCYLFSERKLFPITNIEPEESLIKCIFDGDFSFFIENYIPKDGFVEAKTLFNFIRKYHNLPPIDSTRKDIKIEPSSKKRETYITKTLFSLNEKVRCKGERGIRYYIKEFGPNYMVLQNVQTKEKTKRWVEHVIKI